MKKYRLTVGDIRYAAKRHKYLISRCKSGHKMGINSKSVFIGENRHAHGNKKTSFTGIVPCDFNTYLNYKHKFI